MLSVQYSPLIGTPLLAFACTFAGMFFGIRLMRKLGCMDFPERYHLSRAPLPYPAGIIAVAVFIVFFGFTQPFSVQYLSVLASVAIVGILSFLDDRFRLPALPRLAVQVGVAAIVFLAGDCTGNQICSITNPFAGAWGPDVIDLMHVSPLLSFFATAFWLLLTMNALNWFDGIPGQVNTLSVIAFVTIGLLALSSRVQQPTIALLAFILAAIAGASLLFDLPPSRAIMGDSGTMFFGLMLGILTVYAGGKVATAFLVLGVPIIDLFLVVARRTASGVSPIRGSLHGEHLHHRLMERGWKPRSVIAFTATIGCLFGITALFLSTQGKLIAGGILLALMLLVSWYADRKPTQNTLPR